MSELHEELIIDILLRLPVKSLLRFRCMSKSWRHLIDSKYFINMHCQQSINSNANFHVIFQNGFRKLYSYSEYFEDDGLNRSLTIINNPMKCSTIGSCKGMFCSTVGCCNGLLCIYHSDFDYVLWNPFTRRYNKLPQPPELVFNPLKKQKFLHGFGYDHVQDDYKVVRIFQIFDPDEFNPQDSIVRNKICVYSMRMNSWKHIEDYPYGDYNYEFLDKHGQQGCFVNGASHWLAYPLILNENGFEVQGLQWSIVAFNFEVEKFSRIPHPNANRYGESIQIENLGGFLCVCEEVCGSYEVWVMKQYGVGESWVKMHSLKLKYLNIDPALFLKPLAYSKNGENLLMKTDFDALTNYNLKEATSSIIRFPKIVGWGYSFMCLESLVSPDNGGKFSR